MGVVEKRSNFVPAEPPAPLGEVLQPSTVNVTQATTVPADRASTALFLKFVTVFILALAALAGYYGYKVSSELALVAFLLTFGTLGFIAWRFTVVVASGNYAAKREIDRRWQAERKRLLMAAELYEMQLENQRRQMVYTYRLEMQRIRRDGELAHLRLENSRMRMGIEDTRKGFVPATVSPVREELMRWLYGSPESGPGIYGPDGSPNGQYVEADGRLVNHTVPWSTRGTLKAAEARREALGILQPNGAPPVVVYSERDKSWRLNLAEYATADKVRQAIGGY